MPCDAGADTQVCPYNLKYFNRTAENKISFKVIIDYFLSKLKGGIYKMKLNLGSKLHLAFFTVAIIPFAAISIILLSKSSEALKSQTIKQLEAIREIKKAQIEKLFSGIFQDIKLISSLDDVKSFFNALNKIGCSTKVYPGFKKLCGRL
jgi:hypothetical protein